MPISNKKTFLALLLILAVSDSAEIIELADRSGNNINMECSYGPTNNILVASQYQSSYETYAHIFYVSSNLE